jgi:hypothetical protein
VSIARTAKAAQSSSGEKQTEIAALDATEAAGRVSGVPIKESDNAIENTHNEILDYVVIVKSPTT